MSRHVVTVVKVPTWTLTILAGLFAFQHPMIVVVVALCGVSMYAMSLAHERADLVRREHDALRSRAGAQHAALLHGHPYGRHDRGLYGQYKPEESDQ